MYLLGMCQLVYAKSAALNIMRLIYLKPLNQVFAAEEKQKEKFPWLYILYKEDQKSVCLHKTATFWGEAANGNKPIAILYDASH